MKPGYSIYSDSRTKTYFFFLLSYLITDKTSICLIMQAYISPNSIFLFLYVGALGWHMTERIFYHCNAILFLQLTNKFVTWEMKLGS